MQFNVPMVDVTATPPDIIQKLPLNAAILITDQMENYTFTGHGAPNAKTGDAYLVPYPLLPKRDIP